MDDVSWWGTGRRRQRVERVVGTVVTEVLTAVRDAGADESSVVRLRGLLVAGDDALDESLAQYGVESLTWMAVLTALEEKFGLVFPDEVASDPRSYTILGLSNAVVDCLDGQGQGREGMEASMNPVASGERFRIIDDFLAPDDLGAVRRLMSERTFEEVPSVVDPTGDGCAFRSRGTVLRHNLAQNPAGTAGPMSLPNAYRVLVRELHSHTDLLGTPGTDWSVVGLSFWKYPAGSRLGWHNDVASGRQGEFILFLHDEWRASWGGELLLLDADPDSVAAPDPDLPPQAAVEAKVSLASHCLTAIVPKPNRLVVVKEGTIHCIQRVDRTAGDVLRQTMTGFVAAGLPGDRQREGRNIERLSALLGSE